MSGGREAIIDNSESILPRKSRISVCNRQSRVVESTQDHFEDKDRDTMDEGLLNALDLEFNTTGADGQESSHEVSKGTGGKDGSNQAGNGRWTDEEHEKFIEGIRQYGKDWNAI